MFARLMVTLIAAVLSGISCSNVAGLNKNPKVVLITEKNNGQEIILHKGDIIELSLKEVADAGYKWHLVKFDSNCFAILKNKSRQINTNVMGGYNRRILLIRALKTCRTIIKLKEYRSWKGEKKAIKEFSIKLNVTD